MLISLSNQLRLFSLNSLPFWNVRTQGHYVRVVMSWAGWSENLCKKGFQMWFVGRRWHSHFLNRNTAREHSTSSTGSNLILPTNCNVPDPFLCFCSFHSNDEAQGRVVCHWLIIRLWPNAYILPPTSMCLNNTDPHQMPGVTRIWEMLKSLAEQEVCSIPDPC